MDFNNFILNFKFKQLPTHFYILLISIFIFSGLIKIYVYKEIEKQKIIKEINQNTNILKNQKSLAEDIYNSQNSCRNKYLFSENENKPMSENEIESCEELYKINIYMDKYGQYHFGKFPKFIKDF